MDLKILTCVLCAFFTDLCFSMQHNSREFSTDQNFSRLEIERDCLREALSRHDIDFICLRRYQNDEKYNFITKIQLNEVFDKVAAIIDQRRQDDPNRFIFVIFSESFFGVEPLFSEDNGEFGDVEFIKNKCLELSNTKERVVVQACFLNRFDARNCSYWLQKDYTPVKSRKKIKKRTTGMNSLKKYLIVDKKHWDRIANYTLIIYAGEILAIYRKSTHCAAAKDLIAPRKGKATCAYLFGDFQTHRLSNSPMADIFCGESAMVINRMCSDMNQPRVDSHNSCAKLLITPAVGHPANGYEEITVPILFVDDKGVSLRRGFRNEVGVKLENTRNFDYLQNYYIIYPFSLSYLLSLPKPKNEKYFFLEPIDGSFYEIH